MSSDEESEEQEETMSLDDIQNEFKQKVGHKPHSVQQMLAFCEQNKYPQKFKDINQWWPTRPEPEEKPSQKAVNADDYKDPNDKTGNAGGADDDDDEEDEDDDKDKEEEEEDDEPEEPKEEPKES